MDYYKMLNCVAYQNAMIKMAYSMGDEKKKKSETTESTTNESVDEGATGGTTGGSASGGNAGGNAGGGAAGGNTTTNNEEPRDEEEEGPNFWKNPGDWFEANKPMVGGVAAGFGAGVPTAALSYYGLSQIPYFKQRRLLNMLLSGLGGAAAGGAAGYFTNKALVDSTDTTDTTKTDAAGAAASTAKNDKQTT